MANFLLRCMVWNEQTFGAMRWPLRRWHGWHERMKDEGCGASEMGNGKNGKCSFMKLASWIHKFVVEPPSRNLDCNQLISSELDMAMRLVMRRSQVAGRRNEKCTPKNLNP